ncbi:MAG: ImmA/IrrE family metallo-endopeptidase, partial [bacterium]
KARDALLQYYKQLSEYSGKRLDADDFFPVQGEEMIRVVLQWQLEEVADVGWTVCHDRVRGRCDYDNKKILIAVDAVSGPGERNFTIAHEIGHAVLHGHMVGLGGALNRTKSAGRRPLPELRSTGQRIEREANIFATELLMPEKSVRDRFERIFGRPALWLGSSQIRSKLVGVRAMPEPELEQVAAFIAEYKAEHETRSLVGSFGVSRSAMALRLRELGLLYS